MTSDGQTSHPIRAAVLDVLAARMGAFGDFAPPPEEIEEQALAYLRATYGEEFEIVDVERAEFAHPTDVILARRSSTSAESPVRRFPADGRFEG